jgi:osmotically-inducible protein OsmY
MKRFRHFSAFMFCCFLLGMTLVRLEAAQQPTDRQITSWVEEAIREQPFIHASKVGVTVRNGIVTLSGTVMTLAGKKYAVMETSKVRGVQGVIDEMIVYSPPRPPADIRQDILMRFLHSADLERAPVQVDVSLEGKVVLSGDVDSWAQRDEAELVAGEVRGVNVIVNRLNVTYKEKRSDRAIQEDVTANFERDVYLSDLNISVTVGDGVVTLAGTVASLYEKERAWERAIVVYDVRDVKNLLEVETEKNSFVRRHVPLPLDAELEQHIRAELMQDLRVVDPDQLSVAVINGNVTLGGTVSSYYQKQLAGRDVRNVVGVGWVDNLLTVKAPWRDDFFLRNDIQFDMDADPYLNNEDIRTHVKQGVVTLTGHVNTFYQKLHAGEVASRVLGVKEVVNVLTVRQPLTFSDAALKERISKRLVADAVTGPVANRITVDVENGKAILIGDLSSWAQYREAARVALLTDGVNGLDNRLSVAGTKRYWEQWK